MNLTPDPSEVQSWLEWAGERLLALPVHGTHPASYRSFWPDYPLDVATAYGYTAACFHPPAPGKAEIPLIDEIYAIIALTPDHPQRRLLQARSLVAPLNGRYLYSWTKLAEVFHRDRRAVKRTHYSGLCVIAAQVPANSVARFREFI